MWSDKGINTGTPCQQSDVGNMPEMHRPTKSPTQARSTWLVQGTLYTSTYFPTFTVKTK
ncbi:hypothetical protein N9X28_00720 [Candidatus Poseidoniales archaeon]|nr:hypothetical protein [Candidatus Poseidoniales archaeon]